MLQQPPLGEQPARDPPAGEDRPRPQRLLRPLQDHLILRPRGRLPKGHRAGRCSDDEVWVGLVWTHGVQVNAEELLALGQTGER